MVNFSVAVRCRHRHLKHLALRVLPLGQEADLIEWNDALRLLRFASVRDVIFVDEEGMPVEHNIALDDVVRLRQELGEESFPDYLVVYRALIFRDSLSSLLVVYDSIV